MDFATNEPNQYGFAEYFMTFWTIINTKNRFNISKVYNIDMNYWTAHAFSNICILHFLIKRIVLSISDLIFAM